MVATSARTSAKYSGYAPGANGPSALRPCPRHACLPASSASPGCHGGDCRPAPQICAYIAALISAQRVEKASITPRGTPAISKCPSAWDFSIGLPEFYNTLCPIDPINRANGNLPAGEPVFDPGPPLAVTAPEHVGAITNLSCGAKIRSSPPRRAACDTDLGVDRMTSRPGPWWMLSSCPFSRVDVRPAPCLREWR